MGNSNGRLLAKWTKECESKWTKTKAELKIEMEQWPQHKDYQGKIGDGGGWNKVATDWINEITLRTRVERVVGTSFLFLTVVFPKKLSATASFSQNFYNSFEMEIFTEHGKPICSESTTFNFAGTGRTSLYGLDVVGFTRYHKLISQIQQVPINLLGDIINHIVLAFRGKMRYSDLRTFHQMEFTKYSNYLYCNKQHVFPGCEIGKAEQREWSEVECSSIILGGKLFSSLSHRDQLFTNLSKHQCSRFIDCHFGNFINNIKCNETSRLKIKAAHDFADNLTLTNISTASRSSASNDAPSYRIDATYSTINSHVAKTLLLVSGKTMEKLLDFTIEKQMIDLGSTLTIKDIDDILHIFVEVHCGNEQLRQLVIAQSMHSSDGSNKFPTLDDHFESFDAPSLRGLLSTTTAARKLEKHSSDVQLLRQICTSSTNRINGIPAVLIDLMESYLTPLFQ